MDFWWSVVKFCNFLAVGHQLVLYLCLTSRPPRLKNCLILLFLNVGRLLQAGHEPTAYPTFSVYMFFLALGGAVDMSPCTERTSGYCMRGRTRGDLWYRPSPVVANFTSLLPDLQPCMCRDLVRLDVLDALFPRAFKFDRSGSLHRRLRRRVGTAPMHENIQPAY